MAKTKKAVGEELGAGTEAVGAPSAPEAEAAPAPEAPVAAEASADLGTVNGLEIVSIRRHDGSGAAQLRNRLIVKLSDLSESIMAEEELVGDKAFGKNVVIPPVLEEAKSE